MIGTFPPTFKEAALKYADNILTFVPSVGVEHKLSLDIACYGIGLNTLPNDSGFNVRRSSGGECGKKLYEQMIANKTIFKSPSCS